MRRTIIGSGVYFLDTIVVRDYPAWPRLRPFTERTILEEIGGTCGNVMTILAWMGWDARPQASFDDSPEGMKCTADLARYGCDLRHVTNTPSGGTSLLRCTHKKDEDGSARVSFRAGAPGGSRFPKHRYLRARDEAPAFLQSLDKAPDVYFFDDPAAGHRLIARALRGRGTLVWFEPSRMATNADLEGVAVSDIIKFSGENIPDTSFTDRFPDKLFIQTLGADGLRFRLRGAPWIGVPPVPCRKVVDWEGAGDWTTSAFINALAEEGLPPIGAMDADSVRRLLAEAQRIASRSVGFLGSKGLIGALGDRRVVNHTDASWAPDIVRDVLSKAGNRLLAEIGPEVHVNGCDLDNIDFSAAEGDGGWDEYTVRTWDLKGKSVRWTLFRMVQDGDGSAHGEPLISGSTRLND